MRIVVCSPAFHPMIGGLEEVARLCCLEFHRAGHQVTVITDTALGGAAELPFPVVRRPTFLKILHLVAGCDVFLEFNMSLKGLVFPLLCGKPAVVSHQSWFSDIRQPATKRARLKHWTSRRVINIACSQAVKDYLSAEAAVIPNAYDDHTFRLIPEMERGRDLLFVGRLVSDKGASLLVEAVGRLALDGIDATLTITGSGPEEEPLRQQVRQLGLEARTSFTGPLRGEALAREMNRHRILVVPSLWAEPFGIVALEGIACGCWVIGSEQGGLKDAIGPCGATFPNGSVEGLCGALKEAHTGPNPIMASFHLKTHTSRIVAAAYLKVLEKAKFCSLICPPKGVRKSGHLP
ncbi:MAG: glycosyltransferase family 4 protein [Prosthecobacter sp.]